ncbi:hypothetical protein [Desulfonatronovibrio magnus]|uniref:hypothetical protein n=1 Tax=Desulfonatronovibrio magnus TaxID=698827 RepID=UPI0005EACA1B|nr:hypothetical protein [Desulfonatronovibrio magnus]
MRSYLVEEINSQDMAKILDSISQKALKRPVEGLYWMMVPQDLLTDEQKAHAGQCGPHYMAVEVGDDWIKLELLVRCEKIIRCDCISYATNEQRETMINFIDQLIRNQDVRV